VVSHKPMGIRDKSLGEQMLSLEKMHRRMPNRYGKFSGKDRSEIISLKNSLVNTVGKVCYLFSS